MKWERVGQYALRCGPWRLARAVVDGAIRYCLTRDGDETHWCGVRVQRARYFDSSEAANQAAQDETRTTEDQGAEHGIDQ